MKKILLTILMVALLIGTAQGANRFGDLYHAVQVKDETGRNVTDITNLFIYLPGTTTNATIYSDKNRQNVITIPMTEASANTTLIDGLFTWWGPDKYDFSMTNTDGVGPMTNSGHADRDSSGGTLVFPTYLVSITTASFEDGETITMGTGADWVFQGGNVANQLSFTPAADDSTVNFGVSGTALNTNFNVFTGTALGFKLSSSGATHALTYDGGIVNLNASSNFAVNIATGTSTGATTIGNSAGGAIALDTDTSITANADDSYTLTVSAGSISATATGASAGDVTLSAGDVMTLTSVDTKIFDGAAAETWIVEGTANAFEATVVFTDPTADVTWTFPTAATDTFAVMASTLATNAPEIANSVTGGTNQLIFEGTADGFEHVITGTDATADIIWTLPDGGADTVAFMASTLATNYPDIANSVTGGTNQLVFEGTADASEAILDAADATADVIYRLPDAAAATYGLMASSLATNAVDIANSVTGGTNQLVFEGATADTEESIIQATDPTADIIWILPDGAADSFAFVGSTLTTNVAEAANSFWGGTNQIIMEGATVDAFETIITPTDATADATITLPDDSGNIIYSPSDRTTVAGDALAIPITHTFVTKTTAGDAEALTLANGEDGQVLVVTLGTDGGGDGTLTPTTTTGFATVVFADAGDTISLLYVDNTVGWVLTGCYGLTAQPTVTQ